MTGDRGLVEALRRGDEDAFAQLVADWSPAMLRVARTHVSSWAAAEDVVQDTWLGVVRGLDGFAGRSSLRTWVFGILLNRARSRGTGDRRFVLLPEDGGPVVAPDRFRGADDRWPGHWAEGRGPTAWREDPEGSVVGHEAMGELLTALRALPERQQVVVLLRDVHDLSAEEVCDALGITAGNQRVLLHRGRSRLRAELEAHRATA